MPRTEISSPPTRSSTTKVNPRSRFWDERTRRPTRSAAASWRRGDEAQNMTMRSGANSHDAKVEMRSVSNSHDAKVEMNPDQSSGRDETRLERLDRNLAEMQDELRV